MSLFGPSIKYSIKEHQLSEFDIKKLVSHEHVMSLSQADADLIERSIIARRHGDGKISLQQIYEELLRLKYSHQISPTDKDGVMHVFEEYFSNHFDT